MYTKGFCFRNDFPLERISPYKGFPLGRLAEYGWKPPRTILAQTKTCHGPQFTGAYVNDRGVHFRRIRDFKRHYLNGIPPTSQASGWKDSRISRTQSLQPMKYEPQTPTRAPDNQ